MYYTLTTFVVRCIYTPSNVFYTTWSIVESLSCLYIYITLLHVTLYNALSFFHNVFNRTWFIYMYYTLTLNVVKCFTLFYPVFLTGHGQQEDLYGHDDGSCQKPETQAVYFPHSTKHEVSIYILKNILGMLTFIFLLLQI